MYVPIGESIPVMKTVGDLVFGSTINQNNCLYIKVTSLGEGCFLIVHTFHTVQNIHTCIFYSFAIMNLAIQTAHWRRL